jgi:transposase
MPGRRRKMPFMNRLSMDEQKSIVGLLRLRRPERRIARETGFHRATIRRIALELAAEDSKCTSPGKVATDSRAVKVAADPKCTSPPEVPTDLKPHTPAEVPAGSSRSRSVCEPHRPFIAAEVAKGRNAVAIYQDLVEHHGYAGAYNAVKRFVGKLRPRDPKISCRFETEPGQEMQVDYGEGAPTRDSRTGKYRRPRLFTLTLGNSRHAFRKVVWNSSSEVWCKLHEEAFAYFGGTARTIRFDNLKEGVLKPDIYDPAFNPLFAKLLDHYGVIPLPCRPYAPDLKGKVESTVGHTQETALKGRRFESIDEQNVHLARWNERWAATRIHGTTKRQVRAMFEEEKPFLQQLPTTRFEYYRVLERTVHFDAHIEVDGAYYSAPPRYAGRKLPVNVGRLWLRMLDPSTQQCVREHPIALYKGQRRTNDADRPKQTPMKVQELADRIAGAGPGCRTFAQQLIEERGAIALRALYGMLDLLRRYEAAAVDDACAFATASGIGSFRFLRTYLSHHAKPLKLKSEHRIIPEIATYATHFTTLTQGAPS